MARIIVSAGHTNDQPGTVANGLREVDLTRKIASEVTKELRKANIVTLSVPPDLDLARRISWINQTGYTEEDGDIAVEIHINEGGKSGLEGWHQADKNNSIELTKSIANSIKDSLGWEIQGIKSEYEHELGSLAFLHNTNPIASLLECGYIDNEEDLKILKNEDGLKKIAKAISDGILKFLGKLSENKKTEPDEKKSDPKVDVNSNNNTPVQTQNQNTSFPAASQSQPPTGSIPMTTPQYPSAGAGQFGGQNMYNPSPAPQNYGAPGGINTGASGSGGYMNREDRKEMIKNHYIKILGREPSQSDMNYFLNLGTSEDQLIKRMVDSQEHADLVKARQEVIQTKETLGKQTTDILYLRTKVTDQQGIIKNLNQLLIQKNRAIYRLNLALRGTRGQSSDRPVVKKAVHKKTFTEKFLDYFSDKLGS